MVMVNSKNPTKPTHTHPYLYSCVIFLVSFLLFSLPCSALSTLLMAGDPINLDISDDEFYPTEPIWDLSDEEDKESEDELFWEREFTDELEGLSVDEEVKEFDPEGDLAYLEALLVGNLM
ncbi:hypothetical protein HanXRQr2_Chr15g0706411 [Helianthus annuus]|uniref:Uncharacterized protein n=1 Tax=Helianthus annuus TaxID=4232 RepID=A0A9K3E3Y7_HELAN|nr:hypothetical protein HanXRQr2_Chr15g0706411 [Helianthus annuus]